MKKLIKNPILMFILGAVIFGGVGGVVAYSNSAKNIAYTPKDTTWNVSNVEEALNSLINDKIKKSNFIFINNSRTSFSIPAGVTSAYFIYSCGTNNTELNINITGSILKSKAMLASNTNVDHYSGDLRSTVKIYKLELTGKAGKINASVSGGAGAYRAWTALVMY